MASALGRFHELVSEDKGSDEVKLYAMCKYFHYYSKISHIIGGFELESRQGEDVISHLGTDIFGTCEVLGDDGIPDMIDLVSDDEVKPIFFNSFKRAIPPELLQKFSTKILKDKDRVEKLSQYCKWLRQITLFEINTAYSMWYKENPKFDLDMELKQYLIDKGYESYAEKLEKSK
jgi:hypothetical protein